MTLPTEWIFPLNESRLSSGNAAQIGDSVQELITTLTDMYQNVSQATNGDIRQYEPKVFGTTTEGEGTYTVQDGWYLRKGLMVDFWFSVEWTAHTGTGNAYIQLPYKVKKTLSTPFVGQLHGTYNFGGEYTSMFTLASSNTFRNNLYTDGPGGLAAIPLQLLTSGTLFGHIRYIGQEIEN